MTDAGGYIAPFVIRMATMADLSQGLEMYRAFVEEGALSAFPIDDLPGLVAEMTRTIESGRCIVGELADGRLGGSISVGVKRFPHSKREFLGDSWYYVRPEARATGLARRLLKEARDYARKCGKPALFATMAGTDPAKVDRFYSILGFQRVGGFYLADHAEE